MSAYETRNATIEYTRLGVHHTDHGILSFSIGLVGGGWGQAFGQWALDTHEEGVRQRAPTTLGSSLLLGIDRLLGCDWEDLVGKAVRCYAHHSKVFAIGHYLQDQWLWYNALVDAFVTTTFEAMSRAAEATDASR